LIKAKLVLDLGNSETRCVLRVGELKDNSRQEYAYTLSNRFGVAAKNTLPVSDDYSEENTIAFRTKSHVIGADKLEEGLYVNGLMSEREFQNLQLKPTAMTAKYDSRITLLSIFTAIGKAGMWMRDYFRKQGRDVTLDTILNQVEWELDILLPPSQVSKGVDVLNQCLVGDFPVEYVYPEGKNSIIRIRNVQIFSEGVMAYMATIIKKSNKSVRANKRFMLTSNVLVIDIGAGTTDIVLIRNNVPVESSKHTIRYGGNNIKGKLKQLVNADLNVMLPDPYYEEASVTGKLKQGLKEYDVRKQLDIAKREVAMLINNDIQEFLEAADLPIQTVEYILVVGGGSIASSQDGIQPISNYILDGLKKFSTNIGLVDISDITDQTGVEMDGTAEDKLSTRELNVVGTCINLDLKEYKELAEEQKQTAN
jgi:hypothetical protein